MDRRRLPRYRAAMVYRLSRGEAVHQAALRIAEEELSAAIVQLRHRGDPHARVHTARKAIKRSRALLRLIRGGLGPFFALENLTLRDAARLLSGRRDAAVALTALHQLVPEASPALLTVRDALAAARDAAADPETDDVLHAAAAELARSLARRDQWPVFDGGWSVVEAGLRASYVGGRKAMQEAYTTGSPEAFHEWRKRAKDLWYHTVLLQGVWKTVQSAWSEALEDLSDILGEDHDLEVLRAAVAGLPDIDPTAVAELETRTAERSSDLRAAACALGRRIYAERPRHYLTRIGRYWKAWRRDERRAERARQAADSHPPPPEAPPNAVVRAPDPDSTPDHAPTDMSAKTST
jgi:CHAD domain-containing protein